jgi:uncharacterized membrane protein YphA (DoxX/SURF4 family)
MNEICSRDGSCTPYAIVCLLVSVFLAILFLQSGLDKLSDYKGNLSWLKEHFSKTFLHNAVPLLFFTIMILELAAGALSLSGVLVYFIKGCNRWMFYGNLLSAIAIICLFFGQRIAKDYAGAQSLVSYFIVTIIGLYLSC